MCINIHACEHIHSICFTTVATALLPTSLKHKTNITPTITFPTPAIGIIYRHHHHPPHLTASAPSHTIVTISNDYNYSVYQQE
jgi:hypothetical protein